MAARRARSTRTEASIFVKLARTGSVVQEYCLNGARTVDALLEAAGMTTGKGDKIRVNGRLADEDTLLKQGDIVTLAGRVEGGDK